MLTLVIEQDGEPARRKLLPGGRALTVGRADDCDVVLAEPSLEPHHLLVHKDGENVTVAPIGDSLVRLDGTRLQGPQLLRGVCQIGGFRLRLGETSRGAKAPAIRPEEDALLAAIEQGDEPSRMVYADWLEARGDMVRAEFLRAQHAIDTLSGESREFEIATDRLRELAAKVDVRWRVRVARPAVEGCLKVDFQCPKEWGSLEPTRNPKVRFCGACKENVHYSTSINEARFHAEKGECVALDLGVLRWQADLEGPFDERVCKTCNIDVGPMLHACPSCGAPVYRPMVRGRMVLVRDDPE